MRPMMFAVAVVAATLTAAPLTTSAAEVQAGRRQPRNEEPQRAQPRTRSDGEPQRAVPRPQPAPEQRSEPRTEQRAEPRHAPPPTHVQPPSYYSYPRRYAFPVVSVRLGYYYHPYFGFYYGPYYGPFYPYPGPYYPAVPYSSSALRLRVKPVETEVYLNGYYAGVVDDFDGVFQRLYVPAGHHEIELRLDGYEPFSQKVYVGRGDTLDITHMMRPLEPGETAAPAPAPQPLPHEWAANTPAPLGEEPASPYGILAIQVEPSDAQIFVDDEAWLGMGDRAELAIHLPAGWHRLEVRKEGFRPFSTELELTEGATTRLSVTLER